MFKLTQKVAVTNLLVSRTFYIQERFLNAFEYKIFFFISILFIATLGTIFSFNNSTKFQHSYEYLNR